MKCMICLSSYISIDFTGWLSDCYPCRSRETSHAMSEASCSRHCVSLNEWTEVVKLTFHFPVFYIITGEVDQKMSNQSAAALQRLTNTTGVVKALHWRCIEKKTSIMWMLYLCLLVVISTTTDKLIIIIQHFWALAIQNPNTSDNNDKTKKVTDLLSVHFVDSSLVSFVGRERRCFSTANFEDQYHGVVSIVKLISCSWCRDFLFSPILAPDHFQRNVFINIIIVLLSHLTLRQA